jgi:hypothetical protein
MKTPCLSIVLVAFCAASSHAKIWKDNEGRELDAELHRLAGDVVYLQKKDGHVFSLKLDSLSAEDQVYAKVNGPKTKPARMQTALENIDKATTDGLGMQGLQFNEKLNDHMFLRRVYLDLSGAIPNLEQARDFLDDRSPDKRAILVRKLIDSEGYVSHNYNYFAEILRVQDTVPGTVMRMDPYINWIKDSVRKNKPFDAFVREMVTSEGRMWENPAAGYHLRDNGMKLDHVAFMTKIFLGTDITCAQCHDDPFKDWTQYEYYQLSAFLGDTETTGKVPQPMTASAAKNGKKKAGQSRYGVNEKELNTYLAVRYKLDLETETGQQKLRQVRNRYNRAFRDIFRANELVVHQKPGMELRLPEDYQYEDASPKSVVKPRPIFGEAPTIAEAKSSREQLAQWLTSPENPRFAVNIANRMWARYFGRGVAEPLHDIDPEHCSNPELLAVLAREMVNLDFDLKDFTWVIVNTKAYNCLASRTKTEESEPYYFQGPALRRMSAEQIWDSLVTLMVDEPLRYKSGAGQEFQNIVNIISSPPKSIQEAVAKADKLNGYNPASNLRDDKGASVMAAVKAGEPVKKKKSKKPSSESETKVGEDEEMMMAMVMNAAQKRKMTLARASELQQPAPPGHFLDKFGQSDRNFVVDASTTKGSVPQIMELMNGYATELLTNPNSRLFQMMSSSEGDVGKQADVVFMSILSRRMLLEEKRALTDELRSGGKEAMSDLIWALLNTPEFFFIK